MNKGVSKDKKSVLSVSTPGGGAMALEQTLILAQNKNFNF